MSDRTSVLPGSLDLLILKALSLGSQHGYGILIRLEQITDAALLIEQGALYPALHRLEHQGVIASDWGVSENNRRAKYYRLTPAGRRRLKEETATWERFSAAIAAALRTKREEV